MKKILLLIVVLLAPFLSFGQFNINAGSTNYTQDFNTLTNGTWTDNTTLTGWYAKTDATAIIATYGANTGTTTAAGLYAFGIAGTNPLSDRALGYSASNTYTGAAGTGKGYMGWRLKNNTGTTITSITLTWSGEEWRVNGNTAAQSLSVEYQTAATVTNLTAGTWTSASSTFTSPITAGTLALDGNTPANRVASISVTITVTVNAGDEIMIRWSDLNDSGNDHFLAIDDVTVNATTSGAVPTLTATPNTLTGFSYIFGSGPSAVQSYDLSGTNLTGAPGNITVTAPTNYEVSTDGTNFFASRTVAYGSATLSATPIYVRLKSGLAVGAYDGELIANAGGGATTVNVTCDGDVLGPTITVSPASLSGMDYVFGSGPSGAQNYSLSGVNLTPAAGNLTVTAPTNYEISTDGANFFASRTVAYAANTLAATTIFVRLKGGLAVGTYNSELITNAGGGATTKNVSCDGEVTVMGAGCATDLIISEYIEGSGSEKYIEIYNGTGAAVDLSDYRLRLYTNGSAVTSSDVLLSGMLADGAVMVYRNALATLYPAATSNAAVNFNGDDAVALYKISTTSNVDIIGRIGEDPGTAWTGSGLSTLDKTLVRNSNVYSGVSANPAAGFPTLATEWTQYNIDDVSHLGSHTMTCVSNTITTGAVSAPPFTVTCAAGASGTVTFTSTDAFTGNTYTAQLSNSAGSFASPFNIGTLVSDANSGTINITIPAGLPTGAGYLIRVISSSPAVVGSVSAAFTITLSGGPCSCFEIESILVDACDAGNEGRNEMFRFAVGGTPINTGDITVTWPNVANLWQGICQNATTASIVANINATIVAGGSLVEPVGGVIPAGSEVMFFTNTNFNYAMFDFSTLNYTLVAIFQCPDNTPGHFVNYTTPGPVLRTLDMNVAGCGSDDVTYDASLLYNGDGATVDFDVPGNPTYSPSGNCTTVPIFPVPIELMFFKTSCEKNGVMLNWATSSETNNSYFTIESSDGMDGFAPIGLVNGAGNSNQVVQYSYFDSKISKYYRLKQTDFDGAFTYSSIAAVDCSDSQIQLFPSIIQVGDPLFIVGDVEEIVVVDVMGNLVQPNLIGNTITGLASGMYFVVINNRWPFKVIVE